MHALHIGMASGGPGGLGLQKGTGKNFTTILAATCNRDKYRLQGAPMKYSLEKNSISMEL